MHFFQISLSGLRGCRFGFASLYRALAVCLALCLGMSVTSTIARADEGPSNPKYAAIVVEADTGNVIYSMRADSERYPASLTKMMTLYMLFKELQAGRVTLNDKFTVSTYATQQAPSKLGVSAGSKVRVEDCIQALVIQSANDIAVTIAEAIGGTESNFAKKMTEQARALGMNRTTYRNASGLPNPGQVTTARDLYVLADRLMTDFPQYYHYFSRTTFAYGARTFKTHNHLVGKVDGVDGIKTGYTRASGFNLVSSASRNSHRLIAVVLGGKSVRSRDDHMKTLLGQQFAALEKKYANAVASFKGGTPAPRTKPDDVPVADNSVPLPRAKPGTDEPELAAADETDASEPDTEATSTAEADAATPAAFAETPSSTDTAADASNASVAKGPRPNPLRAAEAEGQGDISEPGDVVANTKDAVWGIQIGAYVSQETATSRLQTARNTLPEFLANASQLIVRVDIDGTTFYRARFGPFTRKQADDICSALTPHDFRCFAVAQEDGTEFKTAGSANAPAPR